MSKYIIESNNILKSFTEDVDYKIYHYTSPVAFKSIIENKKVQIFFLYLHFIF